MAKRRKAAGLDPAFRVWVPPIKLLLFILKIVALGCYWYMRLILFIILLVPILIGKIISGSK